MGQRKFELNVAIHPGATLREWLEEQQMTSKELSIRMAKPEKTISAILNGKSAIIPDVATSLELVTGVKASMWLSLQRKYDEVIAKQAQRSQYVRLWDAWASRFPFAQMVRARWIAPAKSIEAKVETLLAFLGITNEEALEATYLARFTFSQVQLRATQDAKGRNTEGVVAWIRQGERKAQSVILDTTFSKDKAIAALPLIKEVLRDNCPKALQNTCASFGLKLVYVENIARASLSGAALWQGDTPIIILSGKGKTHDKFAFNFLHELGHIIKHRSRSNKIYIDEEIYGYGEMEAEANQFASSLLISEEAYRAFVAQRLFEVGDIKRFAQIQGVQPCVILGRLMHDKHISYSLGHSKYKGLQLQTTITYEC